MRANNNIFILDELKTHSKYFLSIKQNENLSKNTISQYANVLAILYEFCIEYFDDERDTLASINKKAIYDFLEYKRWGASSKSTYLTIVKNFLHFVDEESGNQYNFKSLLRKIKIKTPSKIPKHLTTDEVQKLITYITTKLFTSKSLLDKKRGLILYVLIYSGMRVSEILHIKLDSMQLQNDLYAITIIGKGSKERYAYIPSAPIQATIQKLKDSGYTYLAEGHKGKSTNRFNIYKLTKRVYTKLLIHKTGVHILRHTLATTLVSQGTNLSTIKEVLGHSNISTTMIYARSNEENKKKAVVGAYEY